MIGLINNDRSLDVVPQNGTQVASINYLTNLSYIYEYIHNLIIKIDKVKVIIKNACKIYFSVIKYIYIVKNLIF